MNNITVKCITQNTSDALMHANKHIANLHCTHTGDTLLLLLLLLLQMRAVFRQIYNSR